MVTKTIPPSPLKTHFLLKIPSATLKRNKNMKIYFLYPKTKFNILIWTGMQVIPKEDLFFPEGFCDCMKEKLFSFFPASFTQHKR